MSKKPTSFRLSDTAMYYLEKLAAKDERTNTYILEKLIEKAAKEQGITPPVK